MTPRDLAVGTDGTLYIADYRNARDPRDRRRRHDQHRRRRRRRGAAADGRHRHPRPPAHRRSPSRPGRRATLYFGDDGNSAASAASRPTAIVTTVAGGNPFDADDNGDGGPATAANISSPQGLSLGCRRVALLHRGRPRPAGQHRRHGHDRRGRGGDAAAGATASRPAACASTAPWASTSPPTARCSSSPRAGSTASRGRSRGLRGRPSWPFRPRTAAQVYFFDATGRHLRTHRRAHRRHAVALRLRRGGRLTTVTDADDRVTRIERGGDGTPTGDRRPRRRPDDARRRRRRLPEPRRGPGRASTKLDYDAAGRLSELTDRARRAPRLRLRRAPDA